MTLFRKQPRACWGRPFVRRTWQRALAIWEPSVVGRTLMRSVAYIHGRGLRDVDGPRINCGVHRMPPYFYEHDVNNTAAAVHIRLFLRLQATSGEARESL